MISRVSTLNLHLKNLLISGMPRLDLSDRFGTKSTTSPKSSEIPLPPGYRAPSSYALFVKECFADNPKTMKLTDAGSKWTGMAEQEKARYADMAKKLAEKKREEFNALPAQVQKDLVELSRREKKEHRRPRLTGYNVFMKEQLKHAEDGEEHKTAFARIATDWRNLAEDKKKVYNDQARKGLVELLVEFEKKSVQRAEAAKSAQKPKAIATRGTKVASAKAVGGKKTRATKKTAGGGEKNAKTGKKRASVKKLL